MSTRIYLSVSYADKWNAQDLGARWDPDCKQWYCSTNTKNRKELIERWGDKSSTNG